MGPSEELKSQGVLRAHLPGEDKERPFQSVQRHRGVTQRGGLGDPSAPIFL